MKQKIINYIKTWEERCYSEGIPEEVPSRLTQLNVAPSYKELCSIILKNDTTLKGLGITQIKSNYYHELKRIELAERKDGKPKQLKLFV